jgi:tetratricopeptide (TPR) repeat protein
MKIIIPALLFLFILAIPVAAQSPSTQSQADKEAQGEKAFNAANALLGQGKAEQALVEYKKAMSFLPDEPAIYFNAGMAAFRIKDYAFAAEAWSKLKTLDPADWHTRAKLVQVYQALGKQAERDKERVELFEMWKSAKASAKPGDQGDPSQRELKDQVEYCRDQFEVKDLKIMAFEHFELNGERALRYVFSILNKTEDGEDFRISLGSYDLTNTIWRQSKNPPPKPDERLFHLDGYFKNGAHATYGLYFPEPTYDAVRSKVIQILEGKDSPISATVPSSETKPAPKPTPKP